MVGILIGILITAIVHIGITLAIGAVIIHIILIIRIIIIRIIRITHITHIIQVTRIIRIFREITTTAIMERLITAMVM